MKSLTQKTKNWCNYIRNNMNCRYFLGEKKKENMYLFLMLQIGHPTLLSDPQIIFSEPRLTFSNLHCYLYFVDTVSIALLAKAIAIFSTHGLSTHSQMWHYFCPNLCGRAPKGPRGVKELHFFLQIKLLSFCARIEPKLKNLRKTVKTEKKNVENACFWHVFKFSSILAQS